MMRVSSLFRGEYSSLSFISEASHNNQPSDADIIAHSAIEPTHSLTSFFLHPYFQNFFQSVLGRDVENDTNSA